MTAEIHRSLANYPLFGGDTTSSQPPVILIIGGGYSGAALTIRLLEQWQRPLRVVIAEPRSSIGRGQAYSTEETAQLMNGPAGNFSIHPQDLGHLARWVANSARDDGTALADGEAETLFIPRGEFGRYVEEELRQSIEQAASGIEVEHWQSDVIKLDRLASGGLKAQFADGRTLDADIAVLATGVFPLRPDSVLGALSNDWRLTTPWQSKNLDRLSKAQDILIVGASLSMVDTVASLEARGFRGRYHVISRRGHLIEPVRPAGEAMDIVDPDALPQTTRSLLTLAIKARRRLLAEGRDWQVIPFSLRPFILPMWLKATTTERLRFVRHLRALWDVTAHRAAPPSYAAVDAARRSGRFEARAARLLSSTPLDGRIQVVLRSRRKTQPEVIVVDGIVDARGHQEHDWGRITTPLVKHLQQNGLVRRHDTGFGIDATPDGLVVGLDGIKHGDLFAIGHPLRGVAWESSSLTELRAQAQTLATTLKTVLDPTEDQTPSRLAS